MKIEKIIYQTTRELNTVQEKLSITNIFLFCYQYDDIVFANLLYSKNKETFIANLMEELKDYDVNLKVDFSNPNIKSAFYKTLEKVIEKYDSDGYYKALHYRDVWAQTVYEIVKKIDDKIIDFPAWTSTNFNKL